MAEPEEMTERFWKALASDRTVMLALKGVEGGHARPMTAQVEDKQAPVWFFTSKDTQFGQQLIDEEGERALFTFADKGHDLFATVHGTLTVNNDRAVIDRLWNPFVAAWYEGGKDDPQLLLLCFEPDDAEIWLSGSGLLAGIKMLLGSDPKKDFKDNVARVEL